MEGQEGALSRGGTHWGKKAQGVPRLLSLSAALLASLPLPVPRPLTPSQAPCPGGVPLHSPPRPPLRLSWASCPPPPSSSLSDALSLVLEAGQPEGLGRVSAALGMHPESRRGVPRRGMSVGRRPLWFQGNTSGPHVLRTRPLTPSAPFSRETAGSIAHRPPTQTLPRELWPALPTQAPTRVSRDTRPGWLCSEAWWTLGLWLSDPCLHPPHQDPPAAPAVPLQLPRRELWEGADGPSSHPAPAAGLRVLVPTPASSPNGQSVAHR